jgi:hypothetical protein
MSSVAERLPVREDPPPAKRGWFCVLEHKHIISHPVSEIKNRALANDLRIGEQVLLEQKSAQP